MKVLDLIPLLDSDPLGEFLTDCWAAEVTYEEAQEELKDPEFEHLQDYLLSKKMYDLVLALLDEGMDLDFERAEYLSKDEEVNNE